MIPVISLLFVVTLSMLITRIATVALVHTGLGREAARFQARSAFTGVGFTTGEAESLVSHPVRRRIVMWLMLVGNVGIITVISSALLSFLGLSSAQSVWLPIGVMAGGLAVLWILAASSWVDRILSRLIGWALARWTSIDVRDYSRLLHLRDEYGVSELAVQDGDWLAGRTLREARLAREGVLVLGIECPGDSFIGAPPADTPIRAGDRVILYGRASNVADLDARVAGPQGDGSHAAAEQERQQIAAGELAEAGR